MHFFWPLHCFTQERIIRQVLICPFNTLHEHVVLKNKNRFLLYFFISLWNFNHCWIVNCGNHVHNTSIPPGLKMNFALSPEWGFATFQRLLFVFHFWRKTPVHSDCSTYSNLSWKESFSNCHAIVIVVLVHMLILIKIRFQKFENSFL